MASVSAETQLILDSSQAPARHAPRASLWLVGAADTLSLSGLGSPTRRVWARGSPVPALRPVSSLLCVFRAGAEGLSDPIKVHAALT